MDQPDTPLYLPEEPMEIVGPDQADRFDSLSHAIENVTIFGEGIF